MATTTTKEAKSVAVHLKPVTAKPLPIHGKKAKIVALPEYNVARFTEDEPLFRKSLANLMFAHGWDPDSIVGVRKVINANEALTCTELLQKQRDKLAGFGELKQVMHTFTRGDGDRKQSVKVTLAMLLAEFDITYNVVNGIVPPLGDDVLIVFKGFQRTQSLLAANAALRQVGGLIGHILANTYDFVSMVKEQYPDLEDVTAIEAKATGMYEDGCGRENFVKNEGTTRVRGIDHFRNGMKIFDTWGRIDGFQAQCRKVMGASAGQKVAAIKRLGLDYALEWKEALNGKSLEQEILSVDSKIAYDSLDGMTCLNYANKYKTVGKDTIPLDVTFDDIRSYMLGEKKAVPSYTLASVLSRLKSSTSPALRAIVEVIEQGETSETQRKLTALVMMEDLVTKDIQERAAQILAGIEAVTE